MVDEGDWLSKNISFIQTYSLPLLDSLRTFLSTRGKKDSIKADLQFHILKILLKLMQISEKGLPAEWGDFFWS